MGCQVVFFFFFFLFSHDWTGTRGLRDDAVVRKSDFLEGFWLRRPGG